MSFLFPAALALGGLVPAIIALYLRRPGRIARTVPSLILWRAALDRLPERRFLGRLRHPLSLLLQLAIFLLLLAALARPLISSDGAASATVVVLDGRLRMQAHGNETFRRAVAAASTTATPRIGHPVAVIQAGSRPSILVPFATDLGAFRRGLEAASVGDGGGDLEPAIRLGRELLATQNGDHRLVVVTDRPSGPRTIAVGRPAGNVAITAFGARPFPGAPQTIEVFAAAENFSAETREVTLDLDLEGRPIDRRAFTLPPGGTANFQTVLPAERIPATSSLLVARLSPSDAATADNTARAILPRAQPIRVLLVTKGNPYLENALAADPLISREQLTPDQWRSELALSFDAVLFDDIDPTTVPVPDAGNFFYFGRSPFESPGPVLPVVEVDSHGDHAIAKGLGRIRPRVTGRRALSLPEGWDLTPVATADGDPLIVAGESPQGRRMVVAAFTATDSDLPLRPAFPLFVSSSLHWLAGRMPTPSAPLAAQSVFLPSPGEELNLPSENKKAWTDKPTTLRRSGFYDIRRGEEVRRIAVNPSDPRESDLRDASGGGGPGLGLGTGAGLEFWQWLLAAAILLASVEWLLHLRRITI